MATIKLTGKAKTILGLERLGATEQPGRSKKYRCFVLHEVTYLVGKSGALRKTRGAIAKSVSLTGNRTHRAFQYVGDCWSPSQTVPLKNALLAYRYASNRITTQNLTSALA